MNNVKIAIVENSGIVGVEVGVVFGVAVGVCVVPVVGLEVGYEAVNCVEVGLDVGVADVGDEVGAAVEDEFGL
jgi:hypothetical protein